MKLLLLLSILLFSFQIKAQLITESGELEVEISQILSVLPGNSGNDFTLPSTGDLNTWGQMLQELLDHDFTNAASNANSLGFELVAFTDTVGVDQTYYLLRTAGTNYWGTYVYNPNYCRDLVIQAPHPKKDFNTGKQAIHVFKETNSMFYMLSGTSRCNHSSFSSCSGSTTVCTGSSESFRISDLAHQMSTTFQTTTDTLFNRSESTVFLQLHGFSKLTSDPFIILSNGTRITPSNDLIATLKTNLEAEDALFVDSIKVAHVDLSWTRLIAFTNVQGRLINQSSNTCNSDATSTEGRFIHMEQEKTRLRDDITGWSKVANAVNNTIDCNYSRIESGEKSKVLLYPNPAGYELMIMFNNLTAEFQIVDITGKTINDVAILETSSQSIRLEISKLTAGVYFIRIADNYYKFIKQ